MVTSVATGAAGCRAGIAIARPNEAVRVTRRAIIVCVASKRNLVEHVVDIVPAVLVPGTSGEPSPGSHWDCVGMWVGRIVRRKQARIDLAHQQIKVDNAL